MFRFYFCFKIDIAIKAPTEIFASMTYSYAVGRYWELFGTSPVQIAVDPNDEDVVLVTPTAAAKTGDEACLSIKRL